MMRKNIGQNKEKIYKKLTLDIKNGVCDIKKQ